MDFYLMTNPSIYNYPSTFLFIYLTIYLSIHPSIYLYNYVCIQVVELMQSHKVPVYNYYFTFKPDTTIASLFGVPDNKVTHFLFF